MIIHITPKRSATIPKRGEKKVLLNGICTVELGAGNEPSASLIVPFTDLLLFAFATVRALRIGYYRG